MLRPGTLSVQHLLFLIGATPFASLLIGCICLIHEPLAPGDRVVGNLLVATVWQNALAAAELTLNSPLCRYYEPLAQVAGSVEEVLAGPPLRKLLFMTEPHLVDNHLKPHWEVGAWE